MNAKTPPERQPLALRIHADQLAEIQRRADRAGISRHQYIIRAALGELNDPSSTQEQLDRLSSRLERLERLAELGGM